MAEGREGMVLGASHQDSPLVERAAQLLSSSRRHTKQGAPDGLARSEPAAAAPDAPAAQARQSKTAEIDFARLQSLGLLNPSTKRSRTKEEFRVIKRPVLQKAFDRHEARGKRNNLVMVTSARPSEGKTFTSVNLAMSIATERDYTVLLVDADLTKPNVLHTLGVEAEKGLIDVLENPGTDLAEVLIRTNVDKLSLLPAGQTHNLTTELLSSQRMKYVLDEIAQRYQDRIIIFDAPPVLSTSEPSALAVHMGQVIFVIEAEKTPKSTVKEALDLIDSGTEVSLVLNRCKPRFGQTQFGSYYRK